MFHLTYQTLKLSKRVPLRISRGARSESRCLWVRLEAGGIEGWGEAGEFSVGPVAQTLEELEDSADRARLLLRNVDRDSLSELEQLLQRSRIPSALQAAITQAAIDWQAKEAELTAWEHLQLPSSKNIPTSVTIGILPPEAAQDRVAQWLCLHPFRAFKLKLGSRDGLQADRDRVLAVLQAIPPHTTLSVDANGGWTLDEALTMSRWLAEHHVEHLEQPLPKGKERHLRDLHALGALPILVDESCFTHRDIPELARVVEGINIKMMKCGGIPEALRMIHDAKSYDLRVMLGCYGQTALGNAAALALAGLADYIDLDSHLNLSNDPFHGLTLSNGVLQPSISPGFGMTYEPADKT